MKAAILNNPNVISEDYHAVLDAHRLSYNINGNYLFAGAMPNADDRIIYVSSIQSQFLDLLEEIIPLLNDQGLSFKMARNEQIAKWILAGVLGYQNIGKLITLYIPQNKEFTEIISTLANLTSKFNGPAVPNHTHLGGTCYCQSVTTNGSTNKKLTLQNKYAVLSVLKEDAKGDVFKGIYFKGLMGLELCIIKQGRQYMVSDRAGRDMKDRLQWQKKIQDDLSGVIEVPKIIDFFEEDGNSYLVMEHIKAKTLERNINEIFNGKIWVELSEPERIKALDLLLEILNIVEKVHQKGYVHRDLTHMNFLIGRKNRRYLIDWELAYSTKLSYPLPAFKLGTEGFMSPEQLSGQCPTEKEDIYGLGALMIAFFTNMPPAKFQSVKIPQLRRILYFFTRDRRIGKVIGRCISSNPAERPALDQLKRFISALKADPVFDAEFLLAKLLALPVESKIARLLRFAFEGLTIPELTENNGLFNAKGTFDLRTGQRNNSTHSAGLDAPITAILYLLHRAEPMHCNSVTREFFREHLQQNKELLLNQPVSLAPSLFFGAAGRALEIHFLSLSHTILVTNYRNIIGSCFEQTAKSFDLAEGIAGQVLAAILICKTSQSDFLVERLKSFVKTLKESQLTGGGWPAEGSRKIPNGLDYGVSGIILVLIKYDRLFPDPETKKAIEKALHWVSKTKGTKNFPLSGKSGSENQDHSLISGTAGIALTYLYAFQHLKKQEYLKQAEKILFSYPEYPISFNYSLATGISGLGLVYLKAARLTGHPVWETRTTKIYNVLSHTYQALYPCKRTWIVGGQKEFDAALLTGTAGILFFLLKVSENHKKTTKELWKQY